MLSNKVTPQVPLASFGQMIFLLFNFSATSDNSRLVLSSQSYLVVEVHIILPVQSSDTYTSHLTSNKIRRFEQVGVAGSLIGRLIPKYL